jgi:hypothetical protein
MARLTKGDWPSQKGQGARNVQKAKLDHLHGPVFGIVIFIFWSIKEKRSLDFSVDTDRHHHDVMTKRRGPKWFASGANESKNTQWTAAYT